MLRKLIFVPILLLCGSAIADQPDQLYQQCVDPSDRAELRGLRNLCDDEATLKGYNIGIFRPYNEKQDGSSLLCPMSVENPEPVVFTCLGAPHKEPACVPPCEPA